MMLKSDSHLTMTICSNRSNTMSKKPTKEVTVKEADAKAQGAKTKQACEEGILAEALKLYNKETHSVQPMFAYCRQLKKINDASKKPVKK